MLLFKYFYFILKFKDFQGFQGPVRTLSLGKNDLEFVLINDVFATINDVFGGLG